MSLSRTAVALVLLFAAANARAQVKETRVKNATRLDWEFAVRGFGAKAANLPADYDSRKQRYQLYVPKNYAATKAWPLVLFVSPGDSPMGWSTWKKTCEKHGIFFCSPYGAGNSCPAGRRTRIVLDMLDDVRRGYRIDPDQAYLTGFSGGGRLACAIAFSLPEWFGGVAPVCGTNPIVGPTYLRHRVEERLSVAFITGATDFNRKENEEYMFPYYQELKIRSRLWLVPKMGHAVPAPEVTAEVYAWLAQDLPRRRADVKARPGLAMSATETPMGEEQANRWLAAAEEELKLPERAWKGTILLQGIIVRWSKTKPGQQARQKLKGLTDNPELLDRVGTQGAKDEQHSLAAQAKAFERFGQTDKAIEAWELLARLQPDSPAGVHAATQAKRLRKVPR